MPISRSYNGGSIVYFQGDVGDEVYVLQKGRVSLISTQVDTEEEIREEVKLGEFFGVKSSLGKYPREETAQVIGKTTLIVFTLPEFEQFVLKNTHLVMKMLKVFSRQLRNIHRQVRELLKADVIHDPAYELMNVAESFYRSGNMDHAIYALEKYMDHYPDGPYVGRARELLGMARKGLTYPSNYPALQPAAQTMEESPNYDMMQQADDPFAMPDDFSSPDEAEMEPAGPEDIFYEAMDHFNKENYETALRKYDEILGLKRFKNDNEASFAEKALYEKGRTLLKTGKKDEAGQTFSAYLKKHPTGEFIKHSIYHIGLVAQSKGENERAKTLYRKAATMPPPDEITREAKKRLEKLG